MSAAEVIANVLYVGFLAAIVFGSRALRRWAPNGQRWADRWEVAVDATMLVVMPLCAYNAYQGSAAAAVVLAIIGVSSVVSYMIGDVRKLRAPRPSRKGDQTITVTCDASQAIAEFEALKQAADAAGRAVKRTRAKVGVHSGDGPVVKGPA